LSAPQTEDNRQVAQGNGAEQPAVDETEAPAEPPKRARGRPKSKPAEEPRAEVEQEQEQPDVEDIEAARDRVRAALNTHYVDIYGMDATIPDVLAMYKLRFPDGSVAKVSDIPEGMHDTVIQDIKDMSRTNHFKRKRIDL